MIVVLKVDRMQEIERDYLHHFLTGLCIQYFQLTFFFCIVNFLLSVSLFYNNLVGQTFFLDTRHRHTKKGLVKLSSTDW